MDKIHTISELLKEIIEFKSVVSNEQIYYRGQKNGKRAGWTLLPTFYRERKDYPNISFYFDKQEELNTIYKFIEKNYDYFKNIAFNDLISIINILQHYGFPTRVLDVTQNPLVALYFALEKVEKDDGNEPVIYLIYAEKSNAGYLINNELEKFYNEEFGQKKRLNPMILVNGCVLSERIRNQKGDFILYFEEGDINENRSFTIKELQISTDSIESLKEELNLLGISEATIYPSLATETLILKEQLQNSAQQRDIKEKVKISMSKGLSDTKEVVSNVLGDKLADRKFLDKKKMFAEINIKQ
ncbi:FRG domain-containing protein [Extibacter muris]|uniref:FRG domain-containing protein n=1 Tax=Extibacter muris TaxID=1796622 RepID=A0A4R4FKH2_9FIRM|nr:FRG domain-containing protein [Extibacter muris]MCU0080461.1 FRG domain-containing protein [Extibacter muris]TDA23193.1 FRG domain-containing protein [Extibacter muris]